MPSTGGLGGRLGLTQGVCRLETERGHDVPGQSSQPEPSGPHTAPVAGALVSSSQEWAWWLREALGSAARASP